MSFNSEAVKVAAAGQHRASQGYCGTRQGERQGAGFAERGVTAETSGRNDGRQQQEEWLRVQQHYLVVLAVLAA